MGYRRLLKGYLAYTEQLLGVNLLASAAASGRFSKRDLGELSALTAELARERAGETKDKSTKKKNAPIGGERIGQAEIDYGDLLARTLRDFGLELSEASELLGIDLAQLQRWTERNSEHSEARLSPSEFTRILGLLIVNRA